MKRILHPVPLVLGNEDELLQIAVNFLVNALQASPSVPQIEVEVLPTRGGVALAVRDRGEGIPQHALPRLFDPFFTTKPPGQGSGLGLSLSFDLARQRDGTLEAPTARAAAPSSSCGSRRFLRLEPFHRALPARLSPTSACLIFGSQ